MYWYGADISSGWVEEAITRDIHAAADPWRKRITNEQTSRLQATNRESLYQILPKNRLPIYRDTTINRTRINLIYTATTTPEDRAQSYLAIVLPSSIRLPRKHQKPRICSFCLGRFAFSPLLIDGIKGIVENISLLLIALSPPMTPVADAWFLALLLSSPARDATEILHRLPSR